MFNILQIIKEEIENFYSDWGTPSIADRFYSNNLRIQNNSQQETQIDAELIGYVDKQATRPLNPAVPVYKNPKNLNGFGDNTRGILLSNGNFYLAKNANALHANILELLGDKGIIPYASQYDYDIKFPKEFVAVVRAGNEYTFGQSSAYEHFPNEYIELFNIGNLKQPFKFEEYHFDYN